MAGRSRVAFSASMKQERESDGHISKPGLTSEERKDLAELRRRNRKLEVENEILKGAAAYLAQENVLPK